MGKLGKILAPVVAVFAVAAAVLSFLVSSRRGDFVNRAAVLSSGVATMAQKLDVESQSGKSSQVTFTPAASGSKESGSLAWAAYKADQGAFQKTVDSAVELATLLNNQRNVLAQTMVEMAIELRLPEMELTADKLKNVNSYEKGAMLAKEHAEAVRKRDDAMLSSMKASADMVGSSLSGQENAFLSRDKKVDDQGVESLGEFVCSDALDQYVKAVSNVKRRQDAFEAALRDSVETIKSYQWTADASSLQGTGYASALGDMKTDFTGINDRLLFLKKTEDELKQVKDEKVKLEQDIAKLQEDMEKSKEESAALRKRMKDYGLEDDGTGAVVAKTVSRFDDIDKNLQGKVLLCNAQWNYVIVDLGNTSLLKGVRLAISSKGQYIASAVVSEVQEKVSLAEIVSGSGANIPVGSQVIISSQQDDAGAAAKDM